MKNMVKLIGFTALVAVIAIAMAGCPGEPGPGHGHQWGEFEQTTAPTCTAKGVETRVCGLDATHKETREGADIVPDAHGWGDFVTTRHATCTTAGEETKTCTLNAAHKETSVIAIDPDAHDWDWSEITPKAGVEKRDCAHDAAHTETRVVVAMVSVPGGSFEMGRNLGTADGNDVTPVHTVTLSGFYIGKYEVTQAQWQEVMGSLPSSVSTTYGMSDDRPIYYVSWYEALVFCNKLSISEGLTPAYRINNSTNPDDWGTVPTATWDAATIESGSNGYRLPTEAQWEYAAKGGDPTVAGWVGYTYAGSDTVDDVAWYRDNNGSSGTSTYGSKVVGTKAANGLGLYDMSGNVREWCWDWYGSYTSGDKENPTGASSGPGRVMRGGSWSLSAESVRSAFRLINVPNGRDDSLGFRLVRP